MKEKTSNYIDLENNLEEIKDALQGIALLTIKADIEASKLTSLIQLVTDRLSDEIRELEILRRPPQ